MDLLRSSGEQIRLIPEPVFKRFPS